MAEDLISELQVPGTDNILIFKDKEARNDLSTALATVTGNPLNFSTRSAQKAKETVISLEPIQDLHGQSNPYPAGGGKNLIPMTVDGIKAANTSGTWDGNSYARSGVIFTIQTDGGGNVIGISVSGTATYNADLYLPITFADGVGYILNGGVNGGSDSTYKLQVVYGARFDNLATCYDTNDKEFVYASSFVNTYMRIRVYNGYSISGNIVFKPMIRLATETDPTFAPYSNYCPIDGRTETSLVGCGKNLVEDVIKECNINASGTITVDSRYDLWIARVVKGATYTVKSNESSFIGGFFTTKPSTGSTTYDESRYVPSSYSFTAPITGYVVFRTSYDYATPQIDIGIQSTEYEPYTPSNNLVIQFGEKVYGAKVELEKGTVTVDMAVLLADENTNWTEGSINNNWRWRFYLPDASSSYTQDITKKISSILPYNTDVYSDSTNSVGFIVNGTSLFARAGNEYDTVDKIKALFAWQTFVYPLTTPRTITLTPNEISLLTGVNNISTDGDSIKLTYRDGKVATLGDLEGLTKKIADCEDVEITDLQDGHSLVYDSDSEKWVNSHLGYDAPVIYSTEEREIGVWTDGKPIYQKTITGLSFTTILDGWANSGANLSNIDKVIKCECGQNVSSMIEICFARVDNTVLYIWTTNRVTYEFNIINILYTKTTDEPGSGKWTTMGVPAHHYSTEEQVVGTWVDRSTLYEKSYFVSSPIKGSTQIIQDANVANIEHTVKSQGSFQRDVGSYVTFESLDSYESSNFHSFLCLVKEAPSSNEIGVAYNITLSDGDISNLFITIQYTKNNS